MSREIKTELRIAIIKKGVDNLKEFGYENVTPSNILTDEVYSEFFKSMLEDNIGKSKMTDDVISDLIKFINPKTE